MLETIKSLLAGNRYVPSNIRESSATMTVIEGYFTSCSVEQLLDTPDRQQYWQQLWECSSLPKDLHEQFYIQPLQQMILLMQALPASQQGRYAGEGGLIDVVLRTVTFAVRLAKAYMLPPGKAPEEQSSQHVYWNTVLFYTSLCRFIPLFNQFDGELVNGQRWLPGLNPPTEAYRFRFLDIRIANDLVIGQSTMIAARLIPSTVIDWLSRLPPALHALILIISRQPSPLPLLDEIVQEAIKLAEGEYLMPIATADTQNNIFSVPIEKRQQTGGVSGAQEMPRIDLYSALDDMTAERAKSQRVEANTETDADIVTDVDRQALLVLMARSSAEECNKVPQEQQKETVSSPEDMSTRVPSMAESEGSLFWQWLSDGLINENIPINTVDARVHIVSGFVLVTVPGIFYLYLKTLDKPSSQRETLQEDFERLGKHHRIQGKRFCFCQLYASADHRGPFKRRKGYLIKSSLLYRGKPVPDNSPLLVLP